MKIFLLVFLLCNTLLYALSKDVCYSVQLTSFTKKSNPNFDFEKYNYPNSCQLIEFTHTKAVRCGCFEVYEDVQKEQRNLDSLFKGATIVHTYKHRFKKEVQEVKKEIKKEKVEEKEKVKKEIKEKVPVLITEAKAVVKKEETIAQEKPLMMQEDRSSFMDDIALQGHIDYTTQAYLTLPTDKHAQNITLSAYLEVAYEKDELSLKAKAKAQEDFYDLQADRTERNNRSFMRLDEVYAQYDFENDQVSVGKNIRFWGALEVRNITDGFNPDELRDDPFDADKLGVWNLSYSHYTDDGEFSAIIKLYEQSRDMSASPYVYYYFPVSVPVSATASLPLKYENRLLTKEGDTRPSVYLKYSASTDTQYPLDYAVIFENGYDSQRYYTTIPSGDSSAIITNENAYIVNKLSTYNTLVVDGTLVKLEAVYVDVVDDAEISDYYHIGFGLEHTLTQVYGEADLGLISEYYYYGILDESKRDDLDLFELFQNDLFLGFRYTFNQGDDASIIAGAILDMEYDEKVYYIEYETRVAETFKVNFDYRYIDPSPSDLTAFNLMGKHERLSLKLGYYF
ncbi:hypothetical protein JHD47_04395 [Sulfurimonas sp. SAG-AH-194-L11]|nr:hypothetical protein [Sulfurimonas sp. SAG-AH-194-L11]MDF1877047.1 hypothetical protein [Sulfurimonas sp. SAG-AH-194-L11]